MGLKIGVDIGGTFTDIAVAGDDGSVYLWKEDSLPGNLAKPIEDGLQAIARQMGLSLRELLNDTDLFVHGSTVATNTLIERTGPKLGLICTEGFRDALYFRDGFKPERYNFHLQRPRDLVDRYLRVGVDERILSDGTVKEDLDEESVKRAAAFFREQEVEVVAVALLWAHVNAIHERRVREILESELPDVPVLVSSEILPEVGEWERTSATVLSAYVYPKTAAYLRQLAKWLAESGLKQDLLVMQLNGGCARVENALRVPVNIIASGPAAAPAASRYVLGRVTPDDAITVDMGGTSFEACLMKDAEIPLSRKEFVADQPLGVPAVEVRSIGAGGGSIGWVDDGGALRMGPQSAGARPGPAAYDLGGTRPTVTDANIVLGYLSTDAFLGGRRKLRKDLSETAIRTHIADPLGFDDIVGAAAGMVRIVEENMVGAIRAVTIERGIDPRPCALISGGGAGSLHAGRLAAALGISQILIPRQAGLLSAFGMTVTDVRHDYAATLYTTTESAEWPRVRDLLRELEKEAVAELTRSGFGPDEIEIRRSVDARYLGQIHELITNFPPGDLHDATLDEVAAAFHALHHERYNYSFPDNPIEFLHWRVSGIGKIKRPPLVAFDSLERKDGMSYAGGTRQAYFAELGGFVETPTFKSADLVAGAEIEGPALIDSPTTTILVVPGHRLVSDGDESFLIETMAGGAGTG